MFGAIAGGIASALAGGAMSKLFGGGQKAASGGIQGANVPNPDEAVPSFVSGAMAKAGKDFLKVRCRLALLPFPISCLIWLDLVASLPLMKERILVISLLVHFLSLMLGSVLVLMLALLVWLTPDLGINKRLLKCNWTMRKRLPRCKMRLKKRLLAFSRRLHARIRKTRYMHKMRCLLINRRSLLLALRL